MAPKKRAAATSNGEIDAGNNSDACGSNADDIKTLLSCSIAAAMLLPSPLRRESKPLDLEVGVEGRRS